MTKQGHIRCVTAIIYLWNDNKYKMSAGVKIHQLVTLCAVTSRCNEFWHDTLRYWIILLCWKTKSLKIKNYVKSADGVLSQIKVMKSKVTSMESEILKAGCAGDHSTLEAEEILFLSYL